MQHLVARAAGVIHYRLDLGRGGGPHRACRARVLVGRHEGRPDAVAGARRSRGAVWPTKSGRSSALPSRCGHT